MEANGHRGGGRLRRVLDRQHRGPRLVPVRFRGPCCIMGVWRCCWCAASIPSCATAIRSCVSTGITFWEIGWKSQTWPCNQRAFSRRLLCAAWACRCPGMSRKGRWAATFCFVYGLASFVYRWVMLAATLYMVLVFFESHGLGSLGRIVVGTGILGMLASQAYTLARACQRWKRFSDMKFARLGLTLGAAVCLGLVFFLVPLPYRVHGTALIQVEPEQARRWPSRNQVSFKICLLKTVNASKPARCSPC